MTTPDNFDEAGWKAQLAAGAAGLEAPLDDSQVDKLWRLGQLLGTQSFHGLDPTSFEELRPGTYNVQQRVLDMSANGSSP